MKHNEDVGGTPYRNMAWPTLTTGSRGEDGAGKEMSLVAIENPRGLFSAIPSGLNSNRDRPKTG